MLTPPIPENESERTQELVRLSVMYSPKEERFDRITRLAKRYFGVPIVLVSLVYKDIQWFKSSQGLSACQTGRDVSFCGHAILSDEVFIVENALVDERFKDNPLVLGEPRVIFYAGYPLKSPNKINIGTLCLIDHVPRKFTDQDVTALADFARMVEFVLAHNDLSESQMALLQENSDQERQLLVDAQLGVWSEVATAALLKREAEKAWSSKSRLTVLLIEAVNLKDLVRQHGHDVELEAKKFVGEHLRASIPSSEAFGLNQKGQFVVVIPNARLDIAREFASAIERRCARMKFIYLGNDIPVQVKVIAIGLAPDSQISVEELLRQAALN